MRAMQTAAAAGGASETTARSRRRWCRIVAALLALHAGTGVTAAFAQVDRCAEPERFLNEELAMRTRTDPDTLDDWRTGRRLAGCRVTAAGARRGSLRTAATRFYERLRAAGWTRTPHPGDAPGESSLRMRLGNTDCLFNVYQGILLGTAAEIEVTNAVAPEPGEERYNVLVLCVPAIDVEPRPARSSSRRRHLP